MFRILDFTSGSYLNSFDLGSVNGKVIEMTEMLFYSDGSVVIGLMLNNYDLFILKFTIQSDYSVAYNYAIKMNSNAVYGIHN
jgi:hypothetical protein